MEIEFSYDYELAWGTYEMLPASYLRTHVAHANHAALEMLEAHEDAGFAATWGLVGAAIDGSGLESRIAKCEELGAPTALLRAQLSGFSDEEVESVTSIPDEFLARLRKSETQVAGSHTYSHQYAPSAEPGLLRSDLQLSLSTMQKRQLAPPELLIAPKNLVTPELAGSAAEVGISAVRQNPANSLYRTAESEPSRRTRQLIRYVRFADSFLPASELSHRFSGTRSALQVSEGNFFLRPGLNSRLGNLHLRRLTQWLRYCRREGRTAHIWAHPHNFGADIDQSLAFLERVFEVCGQESDT